MVIAERRRFVAHEQIARAVEQAGLVGRMLRRLWQALARRFRNDN